MTKKKQDFKLKGKSVKKQRRVMLRLPRDKMPDLKKKMRDFGLSGLQELYDYLIVSGIVFRKPEVLDFIRERREKYEKLRTQERLSRLGKAEKPPKVSMYGCNVNMYHEDHKAFKDYVIEENIVQQWIFSILFIEGFLDGNKDIETLVKRGKELEINKRKKAVARLSNDEFVQALPTHDQKSILDRLTEEYDQREFDPDIQDYVSDVLSGKIHKDDPNEDELDAKLTAKLKRMRQSKAAEMHHLTKPRDLDDPS